MDMIARKFICTNCRTEHIIMNDFTIAQPSKNQSSICGYTHPSKTIICSCGVKWKITAKVNIVRTYKCN